ncbi:MAG: hypothetical protein NTZ07_03245 [Candidatus Woesebacteria bacterium]|nr:hypothetical protein [Candidatus Woesebacteria bacterium]
MDKNRGKQKRLESEVYRQLEVELVGNTFALVERPFFSVCEVFSSLAEAKVKGHPWRMWGELTQKGIWSFNIPQEKRRDDTVFSLLFVKKKLEEGQIPKEQRLSYLLEPYHQRLLEIRSTIAKTGGQ